MLYPKLKMKKHLAAICKKYKNKCNNFVKFYILALIDKNSSFCYN